jgi:citrate lyase subunit gamma (acyl carrier protein)
MKISKIAKAGTLESSDILVVVIPKEHDGIELELESIVMNQFGNQIRKVILEKVQELGVERVTIKAQDKGALDCTIRARVQTAIERAK